MSLHYGFSDSDDESSKSVPEECSDADHCDKGVDCDGQHAYSNEYLRLRWGRTESEGSLVKSEVTVEKKPRSPVHASTSEVPLVEVDAPPSPLSADPVQSATVVAQDPSYVESDDDFESDSQDACSRS